MCFFGRVRFLTFFFRAYAYIIGRKTIAFVGFDTFYHRFALFYKKVALFVVHIWGRTPKMHKKGKKRKKYT